MEKALGLFHNYYPSPHARASRESFSALHHDNLVPVGKAHKSAGAQEFLTLLLLHTQLPAVHQNYHISVLISLWLLGLLV